MANFHSLEKWAGRGVKTYSTEAKAREAVVACLGDGDDYRCLFITVSMGEGKPRRVQPLIQWLGKDADRMFSAHQGFYTIG